MGRPVYAACHRQIVTSITAIKVRPPDRLGSVANATTFIKQIRFSRWTLLAGLALFLGVLAYWRAAGPVLVILRADLSPGLPFDVQITPSVVLARPGEVINVVYRIRNNNVIPLEAYGKVNLEPATDQVQIFLTQCIGLNAFQNSYPQDYNVVFRVQPAGLTGSSVVIIDHQFIQAVDR